MNAKELEVRLLREGFPPDSFNVEGAWAEDAVVLRFDGREWRLKYIERGYAKDLRRFPTEESACAAIYEAMQKVVPQSMRAHARRTEPEYVPGWRVRDER